MAGKGKILLYYYSLQRRHFSIWKESLISQEKFTKSCILIIFFTIQCYKRISNIFRNYLKIRTGRDYRSGLESKIKFLKIQMMNEHCEDQIYFINLKRNMIRDIVKIFRAFIILTRVRFFYIWSLSDIIY